jgi:YidC/Oxa1 family membrane protein insertase
MPEQRNLILAIVLSVTIILAFQYFYELPRIQEAQRQEQLREPRPALPDDPDRPADVIAPAAPGAIDPAAPDVAAAPQTTERVSIVNDRIRGSLALHGARLDTLTLSDYQVTTRPGAADVTLLSPPGTSHPYFAELGWVAEGGAARVSERESVW